MSLPSKADIAKKRGLIYSVCKCGNDVFHKYKKENILCETCKEAQKLRRARDKQRAIRLKALLEKEPDKFKTKLVINKLKEIEENYDVDLDEIDRIFNLYRRRRLEL